MCYDSGFRGTGLLGEIDVQRPKTEKENLPFLCPCCGQERWREESIDVDGVFVCSECAEGFVEGEDFREEE